MVSIRTLSGGEARDDRSECNEPLPGQGLQGFHFEVLDSRGEIILLSPPSRQNGYTALVRIRDSASGAGRYTFRLSWRINGSGTGHRDHETENPRGIRQALQVCQDAVAGRIVDQYHYGDVVVRNIRADDNPGRSGYLLGEASARRGSREAGFAFVCAMDPDSGRVRSLDVRKR